MDNKISSIYQEFNLVPTLSIAENIFLGKEIAKTRLGNLNRKAMIEESSGTLSKLGLEHFDLGTKVRNLSVAQQQMIEIGKALFNETNILVMDEPTAVLSQKESQKLFNLINELKNDGISIVYISHRLEEVIDHCDRITVLRDGEFVCTLDNIDKDVDKDEIIKHMVGRDLKDYFPERSTEISEFKLLEVKNFGKTGVFEGINFEDP